MILIAGCGEDATPDAQPKNSDTQASTKSHSHGYGPHGGVVTDFAHGHAEFTVDHSTQEATVYLLAGDGKSPLPIAVDKLTLNIKDPVFQVDLLPVPLNGEPEGSSSRFVGKHDSLGVTQDFAGAIRGMLDGQQHVSDFAE